MASRIEFEGGFVLLFRRLLDNPVFRSDAEAMAFALLVLRAAWKPTTVRYKGFLIRLDRGQIAISVRDLADRLEWSKDRVSRFLNTLANRDMIATARATGVNVITIRNYTTYQPAADMAATPLFSQPRQDRDRTATVNNEGNERNEGIRGSADKKSAIPKPAKPAKPKSTVPQEKASRKTALPPGWQPTLPVAGEAGKIAATWTPKQFQSVFERFRDNHTAKGSAMSDWDAAFRTWISNESKWGRTRANGTGNRNADDGEFGNGMVRAAAEFIADEGSREA